MFLCICFLLTTPLQTQLVNWVVVEPMGTLFHKINSMHTNCHWQNVLCLIALSVTSFLLYNFCPCTITAGLISYAGAMVTLVSLLFGTIDGKSATENWVYCILEIWQAAWWQWHEQTSWWWVRYICWLCWIWWRQWQRMILWCKERPIS